MQNNTGSIHFVVVSLQVSLYNFVNYFIRMTSAALNNYWLNFLGYSY